MVDRGRDFVQADQAVCEVMTDKATVNSSPNLDVFIKYLVSLEILSRFIPFLEVLMHLGARQNP